MSDLKVLAEILKIPPTEGNHHTSKASTTAPLFPDAQETLHAVGMNDTCTSPFSIPHNPPEGM